ncbi:tetratricopeptide repeat protein 12 isoform X1 [Xenopus laevis]|nr:tetratricopeptide repeat protein 12 isoform X1 [Xenopus laevis]
MSTDENLQNFINNVDEITDIIQDLNSLDESRQHEAFLKADKKLALLKSKDGDGIRTKTNRTVINASPEGMCGSAHHANKDSIQMQENFLEHLEKDAKERAERRKEKKAMANALKELGNEAFSKGDYETAVKCYSEGMEKLRDMHVLYTNRAQAYIKLEKYEDAITDCQWALKCNEKCAKAYVHMGKAYLGLKEYSEARKCYLKLLNIDQNLEKLVKDYINETDLNEANFKQEQDALEELRVAREDAVSVTQLLQKLSKADQIPLYYSGGIRLLTEVVKDCTEQTLFRMNGGFSIIGENKIILRSLDAAQADAVQIDLCESSLNLWKTVCCGNEENQRLFISHTSVGEKIPSLLSCQVPEIQSKTLALIGVFFVSDYGRSLLMQSINPHRLLQILLECVRLSDGRASAAMEILQSLSQDEKVKTCFRTNFSSASLPSFTHILRSSNMVSREVVLQCIGLLGHLIEDVNIRSQASESPECWDACIIFLEECSLLVAEDEKSQFLSAILGLMLNLSLEMNSTIQERGIAISNKCLNILNTKDGPVLTRCVGILSRVLPQCTAAVEQAVQRGIIKKLVKVLKAGGKRTSVFAAKVLAVCTKVDSVAKKDLMKYDKQFGTLLSLLHSEDETIVGNTALCLGICFEFPGAASSLLQSDILKLLLTHAAGDAQRTTVQQNAAIALGKLCTAEPRYMTQLRQLNGIEILHSCMKYMKSF